MHSACMGRGGQFASSAKEIPFASTSSRRSGVKYVGQGLQEQDVFMGNKGANVRLAAGQEFVNT